MGCVDRVGGDCNGVNLRMAKGKGLRFWGIAERNWRMQGDRSTREGTGDLEMAVTQPLNVGPLQSSLGNNETVREKRVREIPWQSSEEQCQLSIREGILIAKDGSERPLAEGDQMCYPSPCFPQVSYRPGPEISTS